MGSAFTTSTRRALVLTLYTEVLLVLGAGAFVLLPNSPSLLVMGVVASFGLGGVAALFLQGGRHEFGPAHARSVRRTFVAFAFLFLFLIMAFFQVTDVFPTTLRVADLRGPLVVLGLALVADAAAIHFMLWHLAGDRGRRWLRAGWAVALAVVLLYFAFAWPQMEDLMSRSGGTAFNPAEAESYARDFVRGVVRPWAVSLLLLRVTFLPALWASISNVAEAEQAPA